MVTDSCPSVINSLSIRSVKNITIITAQSNHYECIKCLYNYGIDLNEKLGCV